MATFYLPTYLIECFKIAVFGVSCVCVVIFYVSGIVWFQLLVFGVLVAVKKLQTLGFELGMNQEKLFFPHLRTAPHHRGLS